MPTLTSPPPPVPVQFSNATTPPTIQGVLDGVNPTFTVGVELKQALVFRNGLYQTLNYDVCFSGTVFQFLPGSIPIAGDDLLIAGYPRWP